MADFQPASFIPKKQVQTHLTTRPQRRKKESVSLLHIIALIIFVIALFAAVAVFFYARTQENALVQKKASLETLEQSLDQETIKELIRLDVRLARSGQLLDTHTALTPFFDLIEKNTLRNVRLLELRLGRQPESGRMAAHIRGLANNYETVALQSDQFGLDPQILDPVVSNFSLTETGQVEFEANFTLDPEVTRYVNLLPAAADDTPSLTPEPSN